MEIPPTDGRRAQPGLSQPPGPAGAVGAWITWATENLLRGAADADVLAGLIAGGAEPGRARADLDGVLGSPILTGARAILGRSAAIEQAVQLRFALDPDPLPELDALDEATLYHRYWTPNRPVVLRGGAAGWPAIGWTFGALAGRFRWAPVDVLVRRSAGWWHEAREIKRMPFGELVDAALGPASDQLYADGRTDLLLQAGLAPLRAELGLLPGLVGDGHPRAWIGPGGTVTPTHHDQSSAWQVQLVGKKRTWLASPLDPSLADTAVGLYNTVDPREPRVGEARWHGVEVGPGDAVFVPVGWWHHVEALEPSISVSLSGFRWPNAFPWYVPGRAQTGLRRT